MDEIEGMSYEEKIKALECAWGIAITAVIQINALGSLLSKSRRNKAKEIFSSIDDFAFDTADYLKKENEAISITKKQKIRIIKKKNKKE